MLSTTVIPGFKRLPFFFYLIALVLTNTINVRHVDVNAHRVAKPYFAGSPYFKLRPKCPIN